MRYAVIVGGPRGWTFPPDKVRYEVFVFAIDAPEGRALVGLKEPKDLEPDADLRVFPDEPSCVTWIVADIASRDRVRVH